VYVVLASRTEFNFVYGPPDLLPRYTRESVRFELGALERMAMLPVTLPLDFGEKAVLNV